MKEKYYTKYFVETEKWGVFGIDCTLFVKEKERAELIVSILNANVIPNGILTIEEWPREEEEY